MRTAVSKTSRESTLCTQIAAKQPLALALAKTVRVCHFTHWNSFDDAGAWAVRLFAKKYIHGMSHMKNIHELKFTNSFVDAEHWSAIATLGSLEELSFDLCFFMDGPADVEPEKRAKLKVSRLEVVKSKQLLQPIAAIDARCLRSLAMDFTPYDRFDWLPESAVTELRLYLNFDCWNWFQEDGYMERLHAILMQAPRSLETLGIFFDVPLGPAPDVVRRMFDHTAWKNVPLLRLLTLRILAFHQDTPAAILSSALEGIDLLTELQSFTLKGGLMSPEISPAEIRCVLHDKLGPASNLKDIDVYGRVLHLVDGQWSEVSSGSA
ncbi:hypothetical protein OG21DRAFT_1513572 [Imleria badia]|nr:hypothetical protein OG21DRAFT_1513572 [Imleria badia]